LACLKIKFKSMMYNIHWPKMTSMFFHQTWILATSRYHSQAKRSLHRQSH
jgi:hypothetical protein